MEETETPAEEAPKVQLWMLFALVVMIPIQFIVWGWTLSTLWAWLIVPLWYVPAISAKAAGAAWMIANFTQRWKADTRNPKREFWSAVCQLFAKPATALFAGWLIKTVFGI